MENKLNWWVYNQILPIALIEETNFADSINQDVIDHLASNGISQNNYRKQYGNFELKTLRFKDGIDVTITKKIADKKYLFMLSHKTDDFAKVELVYVDDYVVRDKLYTDSNGVKYSLKGDVLNFKEKPEAEQVKGE